MKKIFEKVEIEIVYLNGEDIVRTSGEIDGDETKYPVPGGWAS